jgi:outer membrane lipoprotein SlyB
MTKISALTLVVGVLAGGASIEGCATTGSRAQASTANGAQYGTVQSIEMVPAGSGSAVAGTVVGAVVGAVVGHQFGDGKGQDLATAAGAVGGAIAGHELQQRAQERKAAEGPYRVAVRMGNGSVRTFSQTDVDDLRVGQQVRIENGRIWR